MKVQPVLLLMPQRYIAGYAIKITHQHWIDFLNKQPYSII